MEAHDHLQADNARAREDPSSVVDDDDAASEVSVEYLTAPVRFSAARRRMSTSVMTTMSSKTIKFGVARRTLGILLMLVTVSMWTVSNFLASSIFADDSYSKPYFVTWLNVGFFSSFLLQPAGKFVWNLAHQKFPFLASMGLGKTGQPIYSALGASSHANLVKPNDEDDEGDEIDGSNHLAGQAGATPREPMFLDESMVLSAFGLEGDEPGKFTTRETIKLAFYCTFLWFLSNVFVSACLEYTTVASSTVLGSTSSAFTLAFGAVLGAEKFTLRKLIGVVICLLGVVLISQSDLSGDTDANRGSFPEKSSLELAIGDTLALLAAVFYALYTILLKKRAGDESKLDVFTFFGFIGLFDILLLWPGLVILHFTGVEQFELPPTPKIWWIVILNGLISVVSDVCWTYSMLLTSPLVIAVGVSLAIPMSLLGQMVVNGQNSSILYWIGSIIVLASFLLINQENKQEAEEADKAAERASAAVGRDFDEP